MDSELKAILQSMQASLQSVQSRLDAMDTRFDGVDRRFESMERLIVDVKESLEREMRDGFAEVKARFDIQDARLERQGGILQAGSRWIARNTEWADHVDAVLSATQKEITEAKERLSRLEKKSA